jgi:hypothetical protein
MNMGDSGPGRSKNVISVEIVADDEHTVAVLPVNGITTCTLPVFGIASRNDFINCGSAL